MGDVAPGIFQPVDIAKSIVPEFRYLLILNSQY